MGETESAVDCGGGEEGEQELGGEQHRSLEHLSVLLGMRLMDSRCEDEEGECKKGEHHTTTTDLTLPCVGPNREGDDGID